ncbi:D-alanyl-D-alanine carboxypeptidase family protein [Microbacterium sp. W4I20]|uniref:D-alanyl-D-alanine carboxypeptidase family protein n=1 Tax=Microbacterium sp. W4I20 TaxID=3042262 RepID=UPI00277E6CFD|nr:D-alanyl-D-alanine carboxypeptidase [Microbacterium sp. W4I20]MDQ0728101.1 D-alanyl-D-alanine carboxypeptidase (penicillin-binding protein 5/6) [Microbacterium sp. W4I20]
MSASDPTDEATGVVGDDTRSTAPSAVEGVDDLPFGADATAEDSEHSGFAADALFAGDAPPPAPAIAPVLPVSATEVDSLFRTESRTDQHADELSVAELLPATPTDAEAAATAEATDAELVSPAPDADADSEPGADSVDDAGSDPALVSDSDSDSDSVESIAILEPLEAQWADEKAPATALTWVDAGAVARTSPTATLDTTAEAEDSEALMRGAHLRPVLTRPGVLVPLCVLAGLVAAYAGTTLLIPLHAVQPTVQAVEFATTPAPAAALTWPGRGSAAVGIGGVSIAASASNAVSIASVTKVVSSLMVLDRMPLALGEQGPEFGFTFGDSIDYWNYRRADQSALDVPVDGVLTEYQLLQGTLLGSANNYIDRLASEIWGSDDEFAAAAEVWLRERGLDGITVVTPSGFDERNVATPQALVELGEWAMKNPVFAQIVGTKSVDLPGAGNVVNTNGMLADPGVVGIKTGTLVGWNLLTAKDVAVGDTTVHLYAAVLDQGNDAQRLAATRTLFAETEAALQAQEPAVAEGTVVGEVTTLWGTKVDVIAGADADVVLWNGALATATPAFDLGSERAENGEVGTLTTVGPLGTTTTPLTLAQDVEGPSAWWRLTHPLDLLGLDDGS